MQVVGAVLPQLLVLLQGFIKRPHERLAAVGVEALGRLLTDAGPVLRRDDWELVLAMLSDVVADTLPNVYRLVESPAGAEDGKADRVADGAETADSARSREARTQEVEVSPPRKKNGRITQKQGNLVNLLKIPKMNQGRCSSATTGSSCSPCSAMSWATRCPTYTAW